MQRLSNRTCVVTGAVRGIGLAIATALHREGANVVFADLDAGVPDVARAVADEVRLNNGAKTLGVAVDVTVRGQMAGLMAKTAETFGAVNVVFNNAGINKPMKFLDVTEDNFNLIMKVNALGVLIGTQEAAKQMIHQGAGGKIINTASIASRQGFDNVASYCASKFAVVAITQAAARALAKSKITVNGFAPGVVRTPLWEQLDKDLMDLGTSQRPGQAIEEFSSGILVGRPAMPDDITGTTTFLASSDSDYMTGQIVMIDGGMVLV